MRGCREEADRSFPLQGLAFRGEVVEPPQLRFRGLELPTFSAGAIPVGKVWTYCTKKDPPL